MRWIINVWHIKSSLQKVNVTPVAQSWILSEIGSNESCAGYTHAYTYGIAPGTRQRRFDLRENRPRLNGASTRVTLIGWMRATVGATGGKNCEGWFAGRLHNAILRHNDCNVLMHFRSVHRFGLPIEDASRAPLAAYCLHGNGLACSLFALYRTSSNQHYPCTNNTHKSEYRTVFDRDIIYCLSKTLFTFEFLGLGGFYHIFFLLVFKLILLI